MMPTSQKPVKPILRKAVLCERVETDSEGRIYCFVPVHTLQLPPGVVRNYTPPTLSVYLQLQEAVGMFYLGISLCKQGSQIREYHCKPIAVTFEGERYHTVPLELVIDLPHMTIPAAGSYELRVWANHNDLHAVSYAEGFCEPPMFMEVRLPQGSTPGGVG
jgi:hypothetical protein